MPETFTIDKNVPLQRFGRRWPFPDMEIGDSFLIRIVGEGANNANNCRACAINWAKRDSNNRKFSVRTTADGPRCWRVA